MSTLGVWARSIRDRPIAEQERHAAMVLTVALLTTIALLLALSQPAIPANKTTAPTVAADATKQRQHARLAHETEHLTRRFLAGYLAYTYGHGPVSQIVGADRALTHALQASRVPIPPAQRARRARVLWLQPAAAGAGQIGVTAVVNDGELVDYPLEVTLVREDGRLLITRLDSSR
jgi:hypothetical protein